MQLARYEHSGQTGRAWLLVPLLGLPALALLSAVYSYLIVYIPIAGWLTLIILGGYVFLAGLAVALLGKLAKCRSPAAMRLLGLAGGAASLWLAWVFFLHALINREADEHLDVWTLISHPAGMWETIGMIAEEGWYSIMKSTPSGFVLWLFWAIEAAVIVGGVSLLAPMSIAQEMFCERCDAWCAVKEMKYHKIEGTLRVAAPASIDVASVLLLPNSDAKVMPSIRCELLECPTCAQTRGLRFARLTVETDKDGNNSEKSEDLPGIHLPPTLPATASSTPRVAPDQER